jgi:GntR family transcriptional regulator
VTLVDRASPLPVYFQIATDIRRRIDAGEWPTGARIASEPTLSAEYGVSRVTIRQAIAELVKDDLLERQRGSGTYVRPQPRPLVHDLSLPHIYADWLREMGFRNTADVLEAGVLDDPTDDVRRELALEAGARVTYLVRRIRLDGEPVAIYRSWFDSDLVPGIESNAGTRGSLASLLADDYELVPVRSQNRIEVVRSTREEAALLRAVVEPLLVITSTTYLAGDRPLEHAQVSFLGDRVRVHVDSGDGELNSPGGGSRPPGPARRARNRP